VLLDLVQRSGRRILGVGDEKGVGDRVELEGRDEIAVNLGNPRGQVVEDRFLRILRDGGENSERGMP